ncbi:hypothetical protein DYH09_24680 [bacterium CPR1]|nr:hypothetical protein [bacterium CPR1]
MQLRRLMSVKKLILSTILVGCLTLAGAAEPGRTTSSEAFQSTSAVNRLPDIPAARQLGGTLQVRKLAPSMQVPSYLENPALGTPVHRLSDLSASSGNVLKSQVQLQAAFSAGNKRSAKANSLRSF